MNYCPSFQTMCLPTESVTAVSDLLTGVTELGVAEWNNSMVCTKMPVQLCCADCRKL